MLAMVGVGGVEHDVGNAWILGGSGRCDGIESVRGDVHVGIVRALMQIRCSVSAIPLLWLCYR